MSVILVSWPSGGVAFAVLFYPLSRPTAIFSGLDYDLAPESIMIGVVGVVGSVLAYSKLMIRKVSRAYVLDCLY